MKAILILFLSLLVIGCEVGDVVREQLPPVPHACRWSNDNSEPYQFSGECRLLFAVQGTRLRDTGETACSAAKRCVVLSELTPEVEVLADTWAAPGAEPGTLKEEPIDCAEAATRCLEWEE